MNSRWQCSQIDVWEVSTEERQLEPLLSDAIDQLSRKTRYRAELKHALRQIRRPDGFCQGSGTARSLEDVLGHAPAHAWTSFLRALLSYPRAVSAIAHAAGYQSYEFLANLIGVLTEDTLLSAMQCGAGLALALEEVLDFELDFHVKPGDALHIPTLLSPPGFLPTLLKVFTSNSPACIAWSQHVLSKDVFDVVSKLLPSVPSQSPVPSQNPPSETNSPTARQRATIASTRTSQQSDLSLQGFLGVDSSELGDFPTGSSSPGSPSQTSPLCKAADAFINSLCKHAAIVPTGLCRLAYIFGKKVASRCPDQDEQAVQYSMLGELLLNGWLVPCLCLLTPGQVGHAGSLGLAVLADPKQIHTERINLTKLLKAIALDTSSDLASPEFIRHQTDKLRKDFFYVLLARGRSVVNYTSCHGQETTAGSLQSGVVWPRCFVCSTVDLSNLSRALASISKETREKLLTQVGGVDCGMTGVVLQAVVELASPSQPRGSRGSIQVDAPRAIFCWLQAGSAPTLQSLISNEVSVQSPGSTGGTDVERSVETIVSGDAGGTTSIITETPVPSPSSIGCSSACKPNTLCEASLDENLLELIWQVLSEPHPLDICTDSTLLQALEAQAVPQGHQKFGWKLTQHIRIEMIVERLRGHSAQNGIDAESQLFHALQNMIQTKKSRSSNLKNALGKLQVAHRLVDQDAIGLTEALKQCSRLAAEHRCDTFWTKLWHSPGSSSKSGTESANLCKVVADKDGNSPTLEFCILSPPQPKSLPSRATVPNLSSTSVLGGYTRQSSSLSQATTNIPSLSSRSMSMAIPSSASTHSLNSAEILQTSVQIIIDRRDCRIHRFQDVGRAMGLEQLNPEHKVKHRTPKGIRQAIMAFQQLPLETVVHGDDHLCIAAALQSVLDLLVSKFLQQCHSEGLQTSQSMGSDDRKCSSFESYTYNSNGRNESPPSPSTFIAIDEHHIYDYISNYFLGHLHSRVFPQLPTDSDLSTQDRISRLLWLKPKHLESLLPDELLEITQVLDAVSLLQNLHKLRSPSEMLASLFSAYQRVSEAAPLSLKLRLCSSDQAYGADDLVPLFMLVVIRANPPMLHSVLVYIERLITKRQSLTGTGYALAGLRSALEFVENVCPDKLIGLAPGEWEKHMGTGRGGGRRSTSQTGSW